MMKKPVSFWRLIFCIALPLGVGGLAALLTRNAVRDFGQTVNQGPLAPPAWLFPVVWTVLYLLMGLASYLVSVSPSPLEERRRALVPYAVQLVLNFYWPIFFFNMRMYLFSFLWLIFLWLLILLSTVRFSRISKPAGLLLLPYLLWVAFAGYLNLTVYLLNR